MAQEKICCKQCGGDRFEKVQLYEISIDLKNSGLMDKSQINGLPKGIIWKCAICGKTTV